MTPTEMITDLPTATTIDGTTDTFPIVNSALDETQQISRNVFLGITGSPVGTTDPQTITTKTLDNTNTITIKDNLFTLQDGGGVTRQAQFQLSGITAGQTRTYTLPDASSTLMDIATAQSASNKTFITPTITSGMNITSGTLAVTGNETVGGTLAVTGVTTFTANPVLPVGSTSSAISNANLNTTSGNIGGARLAWTPTVTSETGTFTAASGSGHYTIIGKNFIYDASIVITTVGSGGGGIKFTFPFTTTAKGLAGVGSEDQATAYMVKAAFLSTIVGIIFKYDGTSMAASGRTFNISGCIELA